MPAGKCGSDISQVWRGVPDPRPEGALYWDSGRTTPKRGGNMRMLREPHIKPHPVVGKCATRTFSSNPSVVKLRSEESSLKRPMLREPHIKGVRPGYSRAYISLYYVRAQSHALLARIMPARDIETRPRDVVTPMPGALPPSPPPCRGLLYWDTGFGVLDGSIYPCGMGGMGLPLLRVGYRGDMGCTQRSQPTCVINRLPTDPTRCQEHPP